MFIPSNDLDKAQMVIIVVVAAISNPVGDFLCLDSDYLRWEASKSDSPNSDHKCKLISLSYDRIFDNTKTGELVSRNYGPDVEGASGIWLETVLPSI